MAPVRVGFAGVEISEPEKLVEKYYADIDEFSKVPVKTKDNFAPIRNLFTEKANYERENQPNPFKSLSEIENFFINTRKLVGSHYSLAISPSLPKGFPNTDKLPMSNEDKAVYVTGKFTGKDNGKLIDLTFQDVWIFDPEHPKKVMYRKSWIQMRDNSSTPV